ncbi:pectate lyase superfamily protein-domain-containing protein [Xylaria grammica]|nr:pectate lyase superfamily protein-domain-containing protein [Xylaria grammica]
MWWLWVLAALPSLGAGDVVVPHKPVGTHPPLPSGSPQPPPAYMKDNVNNYWKSAPDKGTMNGPVLASSNGSRVQAPKVTTDNSDDYWLSSLGSAGSMPFADAGYQFYRNVKDFGAVGDGVTDDTAAINRAAASFSTGDLTTMRCGRDCGSTTVLGAVVYFPPGTYLISSPIIQFYYTQFVGNPNTRPVIKGSHDFVGIALFDSDVYIPGGNGAEWYINQSNFYRQIRNFVFDMTGQNWTNYDNDQEYVPSGIHWQVGQATSITNCDFEMSVSADGIAATAVGIYMENGSGGFVSDLKFTGGNIGFLAGSQQFTANNLQFTSCLTAIFQQWNWGFTWKNIYVLSCYIAIDCTSYSGITSQGTGSISVIDSHFNGVPYAITINSLGDEQPNIVLDNLLVENSASVVLVSGGATIVEGSTGPLYFNSWASGYQYLPDGTGGKKQGFLNPAPSKPESLLDGSGSYFTRSKPQYEGVSASSIVVATSHGVSNNGKGDQTAAINSLLSGNVGALIFFPAGVYLVEGTVKIPVGSTIAGSGWSQIMATGSYFQDEKSPQVVVQVGKEGDVGVIEISDMLFTVQGPTAGAILMEWNVHEGSQGSAAMWDSHFRVGGAMGSDLQLADCPIGASSVNEKCKAASMLLHLTTSSSGYFENVWAWVADHDLDDPGNADAGESDEGIPINVVTDISIYAGRGILIESQGPNWFYGSASEHAQMYQYQLFNASNTFLGHMQTETPYYQPNPVATSPYKAGMFPSDPTFENCAEDYCKGAWALRVLNSSDIYIYSAGFYSFFQNNELGCTSQEECQLALIETNYAHNLWVYNIFTKGNVQIISPQGDLPPLLFNSTTKDGYTSEIAAWLALSTVGKSIGSGQGGDSNSGIVTIDPVIWNEPTDSVTVQCHPPCTYVLPPLTLSTLTTFSFPPWSGPIEVGWTTEQTFTYLGTVTTTTGYVSVITTTTISIPAVTTSIIPVSNVNVTSNSTVIFPIPSIVPSPFTITDPTSINGTKLPPNTTPRTFTPPPWPGNTIPTSSTTTPSTTSKPGMTTSDPGQTTSHDTHFPRITHTGGPPKPTCTRAGGCGSDCKIFCGPSCFLFCPDTHDGNWHDSNDPNKPKGPKNPGSPDDSDECSTATHSSCRTQCVTAAATSSCTSTCHDVVGCDTTGTEISAIYTLAPYWEPYFENWDALTDSAGAGTYAWNIITSENSVPISTKSPTTTPTPTKTPPTSSTSTFDIAIYASPSCAGDYYVVEGPALAELSTELDCITLPNNLPQNILDDSSDNCRYFTNGGADYGSCSKGTFNDPKSWVIGNGRCQVFEGAGCDHLNAFDYYFVEGCHTYGEYDYEDIEDWGSFWCFSTGPAEPSNAPFRPANVSTTPDLKYPSSTTLDTGEALCWADYQLAASDGSQTLTAPRYQPISQVDARRVVASFCEASYTLAAGSKSGFAQEYYASKDSKYGVIAQVKWAENQTGCGKQQDIELFQPGCLHAFDTAYFGCAGAGEERSNETYGGSYVYNTTTHGCILISLFSPTTSMSPIQGALRGRYNTTVSSMASNASIVTAGSNSSAAGVYSPWVFLQPGSARLPGLWNTTLSGA